MALNYYLRKLSRNIQDYGTITAIKKGIFYPLKPIYENRVYRIYCIDPQKIRIPELQKKDLQFKFIDSQDIAVINQIERVEEWLQGRIALRLANREGICLVVFKGDQVAGFNLVSFGKVYIPLLNIDKRLKDDEAWSEQISVNRQYRRQGLGAELRYRVLLELRKRGIRKFCGGTLVHNKTSLRLAKRVGFKELKDVHYFKFLNIEKRICHEVLE